MIDFEEIDDLEAHPWRIPGGPQGASDGSKGPATLEERAAQIREARERQAAIDKDRAKAPPTMEEKLRSADPIFGNSDESEEEELPMGPEPRDWEERKGYRRRAPDAKVKAENERVVREDDQVLRKLRAKKRAEALEIVRESRGGALGTSADGPKGMQEARLAFVEKLAQESDPKLKRLQRKEEEKKQREEEHRKQEEQDKQRLQEWNERQRQNAAKDRELNEAKQSRWQAWDEASGTSPSSSGAVSSRAPPPAPESHRLGGDAANAGCNPAIEPARLIGKWRYGTKPNEYLIFEAPDGRLLFDGPGPGDGGRLTGALEDRNGCFEADLASGSGDHFGTMRFRFAEEAGKLRLVSSFRKAGKTEYGKDTYASKAPQQQVWEVVGGADHGGLIVRESQGLDSKQKGSRLSTGALIREEELVGERLRYTRLSGTGPDSGWISINATGLFKAFVLRTDKEPPALESAPEPAVTSRSPNSSSEPMEPAVAVQATATPGEEPKQVSCDASQPAAVEVPCAAGTAAAGDGDKQMVAAPGGFLAWLQKHRLEEYHSALLDQGFEEIEDLQAAEQRELDQIFDLVGVKTGHMHHFRRALRQP